jgi:hypothetical protein
MELDKRAYCVSSNAFTDSEQAYAAAWIIHSIMLYPNELEKQESYRFGLVKVVLGDLPWKSRVKIFKDNPELVEALERNGAKYERALESSIHHREKNSLGSPAFKGMISGQILYHLTKPDIGSLDGAYKEIISRYKENGLDSAGFKIPSISTLKKIWGEYKFASHFWAAYEVLYEKCSIIFDELPSKTGKIPPETAQYFTEFLRVSIFFRDKLINSKIPSNLQPHIKPASKKWDDELEEESTKDWYVVTEDERAKVWNVVREDGKAIPPLRLLTK